MKKRIFIGLTEISGIYSGLSYILKQKDYPVTFFCRADHRYKYSSSIDTGIYALYKKMRTLHRCTDQSRKRKKVFYLLLESVLYLAVFFKSVLSHDVFIFTFGKSFFPYNLDLPLLRLFRKRVISIIAHGSDARPPFMDGNFIHYDIPTLMRLSRGKKRSLRFIEKYSTVVVGAPTTSQFHKSKVINTFFLGVPISPAAITTIVSPNHGKERAIRILHAPSAPLLKGTAIIRETIRKLRAEGFKIDYVEIENLTNQEVIQAINSCDFVVDQLYSDASMARFAAEAAFFKKPAIVGGYEFHLNIASEDSPPAPPSFSCTPDKLRQTIIDLISNQKKIAEMGEAAHKFVTTHWAPDVIAEKYARLIEGDIDDSFYFDPRDYHTVYGCGCTDQQLKAVYSGIVSAYGLEGLCLDDRPDLIARIKEKFLEDSTMADDDKRMKLGWFGRQKVIGFL